jgi:DUF971 family protein
MLHDLVRSATAGPPGDPVAAPERVVLAADRARLLLTWNERDMTEIAADRLRAACRCAWCTRARIDGTFPESFAAIAIAHVAPVGGYAINIAFDDDHARGIYPWAYLRTLTHAAEPHDGPTA